MIPGLGYGRCPGGGNGNPLQCFCNWTGILSSSALLTFLLSLSPSLPLYSFFPLPFFSSPFLFSFFFHLSSVLDFNGVHRVKTKIVLNIFRYSDTQKLNSADVFGCTVSLIFPFRFYLHLSYVCFYVYVWRKHLKCYMLDFVLNLCKFICLDSQIISVETVFDGPKMVPRVYIFKIEQTKILSNLRKMGIIKNFLKRKKWIYLH